MIQTFSHPAIPFINETFRLIVFLLLTWIIWKLKTVLNEQKALARTDSLTQAANRRAFQEIAIYELKKARRYGYPLSVLYLDLDHFKLMNDRYGHQSGDELLREVSRHIKTHIREIDVLARMGGDEFCVLLIDSPAKSAFWVADKLRLRIMQLMQNRNWPVAVSIGVATFLSLPGSVEEMIGLADKMMYLAKKDKQSGIVQKIVADTEQAGPESCSHERYVQYLRY
jgi:diguanylate cyclase (GGDEF)-like protein